MKSKRKSSRRVLFGIGGVALLGLAAVGGVRGGLFGSEATESLRGARVRRGPLTISVTERGNLEAKDAASLKCEIEGRTTVLWLIEEGTRVEPGDKVAELDASSLEDQLVQQRIAVENAQASFTKAKAELEIQIKQNESDIAAAQQMLDFAKADLKKYLEGDFPQMKKQLEEEITLAEANLERASDKRSWSEKLFEKGVIQRTELQSDRLAEESARIAVERARRALEVLEEYEFPRLKAQYEADIAEAERELERTRLQAEARQADRETAMRTSRAKLDLELEKLRKLETQIAKAVIRAPVAGMVVYGREEGGRRWGGGEPIKVGAEVRERQEIISIPGDGGLVAEASIHESVIKQVRPGQPVTIRVDAIPGTEFHGRVLFVAPLPDQQSWWMNPDLRVYKTEVSVDDQIPEMRPGMSCSLEILIDELEDTLYVPIQAVVEHRGRHIAFVQDGDEVVERTVVVGPHNDQVVAIESGLEEGEIVLLSPPKDFLERVEREREAAAGTGEERGAAAPGGGRAGGDVGGAGATRAGPVRGRPGREGGASPAAAGRPQEDRRPSGAGRDRRQGAAHTPGAPSGAGGEREGPREGQHKGRGEGL